MLSEWIQNVKLMLWITQFGIRFQDNAEAEKFIRDLGKEVSRRLVEINMKGRSLTLKLMKRHPDAPVEPPKVR